MRDSWFTVTDTAQALISPGSGTNLIRAEAMIRNPGPTTVWVGHGDANLGVTHGVNIDSGESVTISLINEGLYVRVLSGTQVIYPLVTGVPS